MTPSSFRKVRRLLSDAMSDPMTAFRAIWIGHYPARRFVRFWAALSALVMGFSGILFLYSLGIRDNAWSTMARAGMGFAVGATLFLFATVVMRVKQDRGSKL